MKNRVLTTLAVLALTLPAWAQADKKDHAKPAAAAPAMSAEEQAMMVAWEKASTPGEAHKKLEPFVGKFKVKAKMWMQPGTEPMLSDGTSTSKWIFGGRHIEQEFHGSVMGMPFEGRGYTGYDNVAGTYVGSWMDSMSTGRMTSTGNTADGKTWEFNGEMMDPMTGKPCQVKEKLTVISNDEHVMEMHEQKEGKWNKTMEMTFTRVKPN